MMNDERLSDFGNERIQELTDPGADWIDRVSDKARYYAVILLSLIQLGAALGALGGLVLMVLDLSLAHFDLFWQNMAILIAAYFPRKYLETGWWWSE